MKMKVIRIEALNKTGMSKKNEPFTLDFTRITTEVPFSTPDGWGCKEMTYEYGLYENLAKLEPMRDKLPMVCDVELGMGTNQYDQPITIITDIKIPQTAAKA